MTGTGLSHAPELWTRFLVQPNSLEGFRTKRLVCILKNQPSLSRKISSMCSITSAGQKSRSVAVHWVLIVRGSVWYHMIEQRPINVMILGCLSFFGQGKTRVQFVVCNQWWGSLQYCRMPKNGLPKNGQAGISPKNKNDPRLEKWVNPLSAIWRIYPSSKWSSQWPYDGYIRHGWMTSSGCGRDSATPECFGRSSRGTIFVQSSKLSRFFPELCPFRRVFLFPALLKDLAPNVQALGLLASTMSWRSFWKLRSVTGHFLRTLTTTTSIFLNFLSFFQSRAGFTCLTAMAIPSLSKALWWWYVENKNEN